MLGAIAALAMRAGSAVRPIEGRVDILGALATLPVSRIAGSTTVLWTLDRCVAISEAVLRVAVVMHVAFEVYRMVDVLSVAVRASII